MYVGSWKLDDLLTFTVTTANPTNGSAQAADAVPTYHVYKDETATPIITGSMATLNSPNTIGFYSEQITLSSANGIVKGSSYNIYIRAVVANVTGTAVRTFQIEAEVDANTVSTPVTAGNVTGSIFGNVNGSVGSVTGNVGGNVVGSVGSVVAPVTVGNVTGSVLGNVNGSVGSVLGAVGSVTAPVTTGNVTGSVLGNVNGSVGSVGGNVVGSVGSVLGAVGSVTNPVIAGNVTGSVFGNVNGSVGSVVGNVGGSVGSVVSPVTTGNVTGSVAGSVGSVVAPVTVGTNNDKTGYFLGTPQVYDRIGNTSGTMTNVLNVVNPITVGNVTGSVLGNVNGSVNNVVQGVGLNTGTFLGAIADQVWDEQLSGHLSAGSTGNALNGAGAAGDPWQTTLPGAYTGSQAGNILASRMPTGTVLIGDKTGFSLSSPQNFNLVGNISGTMSNVLSVANPVSVGTNNDKTGYSLSSPQVINIIGNVSGTHVGNIQGNVTGSVASVTDIGTTLANKIADFVLRRSFANARASADGDAFSFRSLLGAIAKLVNRWNISGATLTVYAEDDTTSIGTQTLTSDASADPITQINTD